MNFTNFISRYSALLQGTDLQVGPGRVRAAKRLADKRKANQAIPSGARYTRQQDRAQMRSLSKEQRTDRKEHAMRTKRVGGSAGVR